MRKIIVYSDNEIKYVVAGRLQKRFPKDLVVVENELTRMMVLSEKNQDVAKAYKYAFLTHDISMLKTDEGMFFLLSTTDKEFQCISDVWDELSHWRYFVINSNNPAKLISAVLNFDVGLPTSKIYLPQESYEYIP